MKKIKLLQACILSIIMSSFFWGCGEQKLDTSSDKAYSESLKKIYEAVPESERADFRENFSAILSETPNFGSKILGETDMFEFYNFLGLLEGEEGAKRLQAVNGLTAGEIKARGRELRKAKLVSNLNNLKEELAQVELEVERYRNYGQEPLKVEVVCTGVEVREELNCDHQPCLTVVLVEALITVKNNSFESVKDLQGTVTFFDDVDGKINEISLAKLKEASSDGEEKKDYFYERDLKIAPGSTWKGKVILTFLGPVKKDPFPDPKKYSAVLSDVKVTLNCSLPQDTIFQEMRVGRVFSLQDSITKAAEELARIQ